MAARPGCPTTRARSVRERGPASCRAESAFGAGRRRADRSSGLRELAPLRQAKPPENGRPCYYFPRALDMRRGTVGFETDQAHERTTARERGLDEIGLAVTTLPSATLFPGLAPGHARTPCARGQVGWGDGADLGAAPRPRPAGRALRPCFPAQGSPRRTRKTRRRRRGRGTSGARRCNVQTAPGNGPHAARRRNGNATARGVGERLAPGQSALRAVRHRGAHLIPSLRYFDSPRL